MAYRTELELKILDANTVNLTELSEVESEKIIVALRKESEYFRSAINEHGGHESPVMFQGMEEELMKFSKKYSGVIFFLDGQGENFDDIWNLYVHKGRKQFCAGRVHYEYEELKLDKLLENGPVDSEDADEIHESN